MTNIASISISNIELCDASRQAFELDGGKIIVVFDLDLPAWTAHEAVFGVRFATETVDDRGIADLNECLGGAGTAGVINFSGGQGGGRAGD